MSLGLPSLNQTKPNTKHQHHHHHQRQHKHQTRPVHRLRRGRPVSAPARGRGVARGAALRGRRRARRGALRRGRRLLPLQPGLLIRAEAARHRVRRDGGAGLRAAVRCGSNPRRRMGAFLLNFAGPPPAPIGSLLRNATGSCKCCTYCMPALLPRQVQAKVNSGPRAGRGGNAEAAASAAIVFGAGRRNDGAEGAGSRRGCALPAVGRGQAAPAGVP